MVSRKVKSQSKNRNRKRKKDAPGFVFPTPLATILVLVGMVCLSYLWLSGRTEALGMEIKRMENERAKVERGIANEEYKWSAMIAPRNLRAELARYGLGMAWPEESQIVHVANASWYLDDDRPVGRAQYASRRGDVARP